jgi:hypothetical protein
MLAASTSKDPRMGNVNERVVNLDKMKEKRWRRKSTNHRKSLEMTWQLD